MKLLSKRDNLQGEDYYDRIGKVVSRKASPPGKEGIESITALGNVNASPVSNFYCRGYHPAQKYWIDKLDAKGRLLH